jgi:hypothetical protein
MVDSAADGLSEYEQLRLENIRRNQAFLTEALGLSLLTAPSIDNFTTASSKRRKPLSNAAADRQLTPKRIRASLSTDAADDTCVVLRRSSRVATLPTVNYTEVCCLNIEFVLQIVNYSSTHLIISCM